MFIQLSMTGQPSHSKKSLAACNRVAAGHVRIPKPNPEYQYRKHNEVLIPVWLFKSTGSVSVFYKDT